MVGSTWAEVKRAQDTLETALHDIGLVVAAKKLRTLKLETSILHRQGRGPRLQSRTIRDAFDDLEAEEYVPTERWQREHVTPDQVAAAEQVFTAQIDVDRPDILTRLMRRALPTLGNGSSKLPLQRFSVLMSKYAHLAQTTAAYLRLMLDSQYEQDAIDATIKWLTGPSYKLPWQIGWLLNSTAHAANRHREVVDPALRVLESDTMPWFARGQAAINMAVHGRLPAIDVYSEIYERAPRATQPDLVAAAGIAQAPWSPSFLHGAGTTPLLHGVASLSPEAYRNWI